MCVPCRTARMYSGKRAGRRPRRIIDWASGHKKHSPLPGHLSRPIVATTARCTSRYPFVVPEVLIFVMPLPIVARVFSVEDSSKSFAPCPPLRNMDPRLEQPRTRYPQQACVSRAITRASSCSGTVVRMPTSSTGQAESADRPTSREPEFP